MEEHRCQRHESISFHMEPFVKPAGLLYCVLLGSLVIARYAGYATVGSMAQTTSAMMPPTSVLPDLVLPPILLAGVCSQQRCRCFFKQVRSQIHTTLSVRPTNLTGTAM
eukprot:TRINITY_DN18275_c1_g2_i1.p4 TRINITY_DN18275_c1_g2~~TRINITY_DN18275_c1_g2_i1.p4  ORF type:complete len:109 (-),score=7.75 TRINITY_DN18275_c1_g2_i1:77-403(-)